MQLAKVEKLKPMEVELKRLEDLADAVVNDFAYMRQREQEMRDTNGEYSYYCSACHIADIIFVKFIYTSIQM